MTPISRRAFLGTAATLAASPALGLQEKIAWKIGGFTKVLQDLSYEKTADAAVEVGWDGIECPVRAKGHVLPERVEEDLPRMVDALKAKNLEVLALATEIRGADEPHTEKVLRTALKLGIRLRPVRLLLMGVIPLIVLGVTIHWGFAAAAGLYTLVLWSLYLIQFRNNTRPRTMN